MFRINRPKKIKTDRRQAVDLASLIVMGAAFIALIALVYYNVRPLNLVDIKVPVSTEKPTYKPGEHVNGVFFGSIFYEGKVDIYRDVFCAGYRERILTVEGEEIFSGNSRPIKLEGAVRSIGKLPEDVPIGKNCVIQFVNSYEINTPFGSRHEERTYYTQNFLIVSPEEQESERESQPDTPVEQTSPLFERRAPDQPPGDRRSGSSGDEQQNRNNTTPQAPSQTPAEGESSGETPATDTPPVSPVERCVVDLLGIRVLCRTEFR